MGFYGTLKMIFYKVSRKGGGFSFFALCVVARRRCHLQRARLLPFLRCASRTADCAATAEYARGSCRRPPGDAAFSPTACYVVISMQRCGHPPPHTHPAPFLLNTVTSIAVQKQWHQWCSCTVIQEALASILTETIFLLFKIDFSGCVRGRGSNRASVLAESLPAPVH